MEYYSAIKKNTFESVLMRWMKLEPIIQSEVSQKKKHQYSILTHIYGIQKDGNNYPVHETAKETLRISFKVSNHSWDLQHAQIMQNIKKITEVIERSWHCESYQEFVFLSLQKQFSCFLIIYSSHHHLKIRYYCFYSTDENTETHGVYMNCARTSAHHFSQCFHSLIVSTDTQKF